VIFFLCWTFFTTVTDRLTMSTYFKLSTRLKNADNSINLSRKSSLNCQATCLTSKLFTIYLRVLSSSNPETGSRLPDYLCFSDKYYRYYVRRFKFSNNQQIGTTANKNNCFVYVGTPCLNTNFKHNAWSERKTIWPKCYFRP